LKQISDKDVAVIILNWNAYMDTFECLKSLEHLTYTHFHIFLVDNDSKDDSFKKLQQDYEKGKFNLSITFIQTAANLGFAGGNNVGIKAAYNRGYQYFWLLNNDTVVDSNALTPLVDAIKNYEGVGIVGSKIYYYGTKKIWFAGGKVNKWTGKTKHIGYREEFSKKHNNTIEVDYITGCSLLFRKELINQLGYMSEDYFLYYEETEYNLKTKMGGWKILFIPESIVYHKVSNSSGGEENIAPYYDYYDLRNSFILIKRTQSNLKTIVCLFYLFVKFFKKLIKILIKRHKNKKVRIRYLFLGLKDALSEKMGKHIDI
jgi:GT2 family glycosyltransferase